MNARSIVGICSVLGLCGCAVRDGAMYRDDTRKLLEPTRKRLSDCYNVELQKDAQAGGKVIVSFTVKKDTGLIVDPKVDDLQSTPNRMLRKCVVQALEGLKLDPPDERDGAATFTWLFQPKK
jgi:outer membrane biosynthesis protein TonB